MKIIKTFRQSVLSPCLRLQLTVRRRRAHRCFYYCSAGNVRRVRRRSRTRFHPSSVFLRIHTRDGNRDRKRSEMLSTRSILRLLLLAGADVQLSLFKAGCGMAAGGESCSVALPPFRRQRPRHGALRRASAPTPEKCF